MATYYQITLVSHLDDSWAEWFDGLTVSRLPTGETLLSGELVDQAALYGVLAKIRDLGLVLTAVSTATHHDEGIGAGEQGAEYPKLVRRRSNGHE